MKAKSGKAAVAPLVWGVFLWIFVPAGLFFAGYKLVGPKIGEVPALKDKAESVEKLIAADGTKKKPKIQDATDDTPVDNGNGPEIEIHVQKATGRAPRRSNLLTGDEQPKPKRRKRRSTTPKAPPTHVRDEASGDAAVGGGDGPSDPAGGGTGGRG